MQLFCEHWPNTIRYLYFFFYIATVQPINWNGLIFFYYRYFFHIVPTYSYRTTIIFRAQNEMNALPMDVGVFVCVVVTIFGYIDVFHFKINCLSIIKLFVILIFFVCFCSCRTEQPQWKIFDLISLFIHFVTFAFLSSLSKCFYYNYYFTSLFYKM